MNPLIGVLVLILLGLLGARLSFAVRRAPLGPRLIVATGTHFLFLGFIAGSHGLDLLNRATIDQLYPLLALGLGWIGLLFGLQLDRRHLGHFPRSYLAVAIGQSIIAFLVSFGAGLILLADGATAAPNVQAVLLVTAATACISTPAGIALISNTFLVSGKVSQLLFFIASLDGVVGILALQLAYAFHHPLALAGLSSGLSGAAWFGIATALGAIFGLLFLWFTRPTPGREELTLSLLGLVVLSAGTGFYLGLSPLFVSLVTGAVIANFSAVRRRVFAVLQAWEQPIYVILLILAGALLNFPTWLVVPLAAVYLLARIAGKLIGGFLATRLVPMPFRPPAQFGIGLIPQGGISLAMAISVMLTYGSLGLGQSNMVEILFATVVLGVLISELIGPFWTRNLLRRSGEIQPRVETELSHGSGAPSSSVAVPSPGVAPSTWPKREP